MCVVSALVPVVYRAAYHDEWSGKVSDYMNTEIGSIDANRHIIELPELIKKTPYPLYPVVEQSRLVGQVTARDILKTLRDVKAQPEPTGPGV